MNRILRLCTIFSLVLGSVAMAILGALVWYALEDLPKIDALKDYHPPQSTIVFDRRGAQVGRFYDERRTVISLNKLPRYVPLAFVAAEDGDFFEHRGIDYFGLLRAIAQEIKFRTVGGRRLGGSTITQQSARAMLLSSTQTYVRKIKEIILAKRIEDALTKEQILSLYLNQIYFGNGAYGIEEAALTYFEKPACELELFEAAALASVPKSPNRINPFGDSDRVKARQAYVLDQMVKHNFIDEKAANNAKEALLFSATSDKSTTPIAPYFLSALKNELVAEVGEEVIHNGGMKVYSTLDLRIQKYAEEALQDGLKAFDKSAGFRGPRLRPNQAQNQELSHKLDSFKKRVFASKEKKNKVWNLRALNAQSIARDLEAAVKNTKVTQAKNGLIIGARVLAISNSSATIDLGSSSVELPFHGLSWARPFHNGAKKPLPTKISDVLQLGDIILVKLHDVDSKMWVSLEQDPIINGGLVALDVETGGVLAMVGGYDYQVSPFNRTMQNRRQPGSGIKPFVYALAIDKKVATASTLITDAPKAFFDPGSQEFWRPRNHNNKFLGDITLRRCLRSSVNTCTITLLEKVGIDSFLTMAKKLNLSTPQTPYPRNLTIALGSGESFPINMANAMRIFPNQGLYSPYKMINKYKLASGEEKRSQQIPAEQIISPGAAYIVTNILQDVVKQTDRKKLLEGVNNELAGKTGTTNLARSVWFTGFSRDVVICVFIGYDDNQTLGSDAWGSTAAFPIWAQLMRNISDPEESLVFKTPSDVEWRSIDAQTGQLQEDSQFDEEENKSHFKEVYLVGTAPDHGTTEAKASLMQEMGEHSVFAP